MTDERSKAAVVRSDIVFVFALGLACYMAWLLRDVLVLLYVSALFAVVLAPVVQAVSPVHVGRLAAVQGHRRSGIAAGDGGIADRIWLSGSAAGDSRSAGVSKGDAGANAGSSWKACGTFRLPIGSIPTTRFAQCRTSRAARRPICCSRSRTGRALFSIVMGFILTDLFHSGGRPCVSLVSFLLSAAEAANGWTDAAAGRGPDGQVAAGAGKPDADSGAYQHDRVSLAACALCVCAGSADGVAECHSGHRARP